MDTVQFKASQTVRNNGVHDRCNVYIKHIMNQFTTTINVRISARGAYLIFLGEKEALIRRGVLISFINF